MRDRTEETGNKPPKARANRSARLAEALRANLARRKAQKRARSQVVSSPAGLPVDRNEQQED
jgi:hypothetical protein